MSAGEIMNQEQPIDARYKWLIVSYATVICLLLVLCFASPVAAQTNPPPETSGVERLSEIASGFVPLVKSIVETLMLKRFVWLATIFAQLVMAASFLKLMSEKMGPTKDFFGWIARCLIFLPLIITGPFIVTYMYKVGQVLTNPLQTPITTIRNEFDLRYGRFVEGHFMADGIDTPFRDPNQIIPPTGNGREQLIGVLKDKATAVRTVEEMLEPTTENMPKLFAMLSWARSIMSFADFLLIIITGLLMIAFRLAVPWMLAVAVDKSLAHEITYRFARGVIVFTLIFPVVASIMRIIAYLFGLVGMSAYDYTAFAIVPDTIQVVPTDPFYNTPLTIGVAGFTMLISSLCLLASPVISWKIAFGQTFEGVATVASGWMAAVVGSGINLISAQVGASLNNAADRLNIEASASSGLITTNADAVRERTMTGLGLQRSLTGIGAANTLQKSLNNAGTTQNIRNMQVQLTQELKNYGASASAERGMYNVTGEQGVMSAGVATVREQDMADLNFQTQDRLVDEQWRAQKWGAAGSVLGVRAGARADALANSRANSRGETRSSGGDFTGSTVGSNAGSTIGQYGVLSVQKGNIEHVRDETIGITNEAMASTINNTNTIVGRQQQIVDEKYGAMADSARERTSAQIGAARGWNAAANSASDRFAGTQSGAERTFAVGANQAIDVRLGENTRAIETVRAAGMEAAEHRRMAQVLGQISHDIARRIEEMGAYRF